MRVTAEEPAAENGQAEGDQAAVWVEGDGERLQVQLEFG